MTIHLTAAGLRRAADVLDKLAEIENATGVRFDGAYNGHVMVSISDTNDPEATEALKLVRLSEAQASSDVTLPRVYAFEFEVS